METLLLLIVFGVALAALVRASSAHDRANALEQRLHHLEDAHAASYDKSPPRTAPLPPQIPPPMPVSPKPPVVAKDEDFSLYGFPGSVTKTVANAPVPSASPTPSNLPKPEPQPEALPLYGTPAPEAAAVPQKPRSSVPPPLPPPATVIAKATPPPEKQPVPRAVKAELNLEQFLGAKLFSWLGGLALFLGVIYGIRLAVQYVVIPPSVRVAMGFITGLGLAIAGLKLQCNERYRILAHAFAATGVLVLYGVTFAARVIYHFAWLNETTTFLLMSLITVAAFLMAVRMDAQIVAVLGMIGGFLTPPLCSTGEDNPFGLFSYVALLDLGLIAVARHKRWFHLLPLSAICTVLMQAGWAGQFFHAGHYELGAKTWIMVAVFTGFAWLFTGASRWCAQVDKDDLLANGSALFMNATATLAAFVMLSVSEVSLRPVVLYTWLLLLNAAVLWLAWSDRRLAWTQAVIGTATFLHLACWTLAYVTTDRLIPALALYLVFGMGHTTFSIISVRKHGRQASAAWLPVITLILTLLPMLKLPAIPFILWPALLLVNLMVIGVALTSRKVLPVLAALMLTLGSALLFLFKMPCLAVSLWPFLSVLGVFSLLFAVASLVMAKRMTEDEPLVDWLPSLSATMPFALLVIATVHLPVLNPTPLFGFAVGLGAFLLFLAWRGTHPELTLTSTLCLLAVQAVWTFHHYQSAQPWLALPWIIGIGALLISYPIITTPRWDKHTLPWISSAVTMLGTFALVRHAMVRSWPEFSAMGLLPFASAIVAMLPLHWVRKQHGLDNPARLSQLAWLGGTALCFVTLIFPMQFDRQWLTIGWAMEGAALCWLFGRVPHPGLRYVALTLLSVSFVRLGLNPEVFHYHTREGMAVWNWFLYSYGLVACAQFAAAYVLPPNHRLGELNLSALFYSFGGFLLFVLMNIEIADAFTTPSERFIVFDFSGNLARDMTYTIAWGLFALALLVLGFRFAAKPTRYAGIGLLGITLLKLFFHDLAGIEGIYRVGALMVVALIAFAASWLYQRFADVEKA